MPEPITDEVIGFMLKSMQALMRMQEKGSLQTGTGEPS